MPSNRKGLHYWFSFIIFWGLLVFLLFEAIYLVLNPSANDMGLLGFFLVAIGIPLLLFAGLLYWSAQRETEHPLSKAWWFVFNAPIMLIALLIAIINTYTGIASPESRDNIFVAIPATVIFLLYLNFASKKLQKS